MSLRRDRDYAQGFDMCAQMRDFVLEPAHNVCLLIVQKPARAISS